MSRGVEVAERKLTVAVLFGGRSCEHEVSILTAHEAMSTLRAMPGYAVVPVYITKDGRWLSGQALGQLDKFAQPELLEKECRPVVLRPMTEHPLTVEMGGWPAKSKPLDIDVVLPLIHGPNGEDGTLQGALEMLGLPYAGSGVAASALCMDKIAMKRMFTEAGLPQAPFIAIDRASWLADRQARLAQIEALSGTVFVKPARGGSSIGITSVEGPVGLGDAIDLAFTFDDEVVVEAAVTGAIEINCAVLKAGGAISTSALESVRAKDGFLSYDQKYLQWSKGSPTDGAKASGGHQVPAELPDELADSVRELAVRAFESCMCDGVARIDFLVQGRDVFVNEINTLPGSLAFYLWEAVGVPFDQLLDRMLRSALATAERRRALTYSLDRNLLADIEARKGVKSR
jgi:D-alanine-D-alanine ligase